MPIWPDLQPTDGAPSGHEKISHKGSITNVSEPHLRIYRPQSPNGTAALVIAGGGYAHIEAGSESTPCCQWLQSRGITAFELVYRLPGEGWPVSAPFADAQRAMRLARSRAAALGFEAGRLGIIGFSAGAHLAGMTAVQPDAALAPARDGIDAAPAAAAFAALIYPVLTMMPPNATTHAARIILGHAPSEQDRIAYSVERHVGSATPPVFLAQAADDPVSPIDNSLLMYRALADHKVAAELHVFQSGKHGWGMGKTGDEPHSWPDLFAAWLAANRFRA